MSEHVIGHARFVDGTTRPVFADGERQYVMDEGEHVYGLFVVPKEDRCDVPMIVDHDPDTQAAKKVAQALQPKRSKRP